MKTFSSKLLYSIDKHCFIMILPTVFGNYTQKKPQNFKILRLQLVVLLSYRLVVFLLHHLLHCYQVLSFFQSRSHLSEAFNDIELAVSLFDFNVF